MDALGVAQRVRAAWLIAPLVAAALAPPTAFAVDWSGRTLPAGVAKSRIVVDGLHTRLLQAGPANATEAIVFVHGNPGSSLDWVHLVANAGRVGRAVAIDMPGFGRADKPGNFDYTVEGEARFLNDALAKLGIRHVHLVLHDFGGPFGLQWAAEHPGALDSVVLMNTGVLLNYFGHAIAHIWRTPVVGELFMGTVNHDSFSLVVQSGNPRPLPQDFVDRMYDEFDQGTRSAVLKLYRSFNDPDGTGRRQAAVLRRRVRPALVIWGQFDPYIPIYVAYEQGEAFPGVQVQVFDDSAHWPFVDNVDRTDSLVMPFWRRVVRGGTANHTTGAGVLRRLRISFARPNARAARRLRSLPVRVCVTGGGPADGVRIVLRLAGRHGRRIASTGAPRSVDGCRKLAIPLRGSLGSGRYRLVASGRGFADESVAFRVR